MASGNGGRPYLHLELGGRTTGLVGAHLEQDHVGFARGQGRLGGGSGGGCVQGRHGDRLVANDDAGGLGSVAIHPGPAWKEQQRGREFLSLKTCYLAGHMIYYFQESTTHHTILNKYE